MNANRFELSGFASVVSSTVPLSSCGLLKLFTGSAGGSPAGSTARCDVSQSTQLPTRCSRSALKGQASRLRSQ